MSDTVLDLIDGAIAQHGDAMVWSANPPPDEPDGLELRHITASFDAPVGGFDNIVMTLARQWCHLCPGERQVCIEFSIYGTVIVTCQTCGRVLFTAAGGADG